MNAWTGSMISDVIPFVLGTSLNMPFTCLSLKLAFRWWNSHWVAFEVWLPHYRTLSCSTISDSAFLDPIETIPWNFRAFQGSNCLSRWSSKWFFRIVGKNAHAQNGPLLFEKYSSILWTPHVSIGELISNPFVCRFYPLPLPPSSTAPNSAHWPGLYSKTCKTSLN